MMRFTLGALSTLIAVGTLAFSYAGDMMFQTRLSPYDFDTTVNYIQYSSTSYGWVSSGVGNVSGGIKRDRPSWEGPRVKNVKYCSSLYSHQVIEVDPRLANLMPCKATVWECGDSVCVTTMRAGVVGVLFGVGDIMKGVTSNVEAFLDWEKYDVDDIPQAATGTRGKSSDNSDVGC